MHVFTHHPTSESLREAIDQRCSVCIVLWETLEPEQQSLLMDATQLHEDSTSVTSLEACTTFKSRKLPTHREGYWINIYFRYPVHVSKTLILPFTKPRVFTLEPINGKTSFHSSPRRAD